MDQNRNPLQQYFRQPAIYLRLPGNGQGWKQGALDMPQNGELPVFPMTAVDEITYRTPDALFSGQAVVDVIQSCIPAVKNAWHVPSVDLTAILVAIRIASYGQKLDLQTTCPSCKTESEFALDLNSVLTQLAIPDYTNPLRLGDLEITFKSLDYEQQNRINLDQFEYQRLIRAVPESDATDDQKLQQMNQIMKSITELTVKTLAISIYSIKTPSSLVTDINHIIEFMQNCDRQMFEKIKDHVVELRQISELKPLDLICPECKHSYQQTLNLDTASFFGTAS